MCAPTDCNFDLRMPPFRPGTRVSGRRGRFTGWGDTIGPVGPSTRGNGTKGNGMATAGTCTPTGRWCGRTPRPCLAFHASGPAPRPCPLRSVPNADLRGAGAGRVRLGGGEAARVRGRNAPRRWPTPVPRAPRLHALRPAAAACVPLLRQRSLSVPAAGKLRGGHDGRGGGVYRAAGGLTAAAAAGQVAAGVGAGSGVLAINGPIGLCVFLVVRPHQRSSA